LRPHFVVLFVIVHSAALCGVLLLSACVFHRVGQQQEKLAAMCRISGTLSAPQEPGNPLVVVLIRHDGTRREIFDDYVLERPGRWYFVATPGTILFGGLLRPQ
jgi:hypothetical protein